MKKDTPTIKKDGFEICEGFKISQIKSGSKFCYLADLGERSGKRIRKRFDLLKDARNFARSKRIEIENKGISALQFTDQQKADAVEALHLLKEYGVNLREVAHFYIKHNQKVDHTNETRALVQQYLQIQKERVERGEKRPRSYEEDVQRLTRFADGLGDFAVSAIEASDIDGWLDEVGASGTNRKNLKRYVSIFFNWAIRQKKASINPVKETKEVKLPSHTPEIYTPKEVEAILYKAEQQRPDIVPYLAIAFFGGVRPMEIQRLEWEDIDLTLDEIRITADKSKTHSARVVHISENLKKWLFRYRKADGLIFPLSETSLKKRRTAIYNLAGVKPIQDGARHSFATYHLALHGIDDTLQELGHTSPQMLFKHYRGIASNRKAQAKKFFEIEPFKAVEALPFVPRLVTEAKTATERSRIGVA